MSGFLCKSKLLSHRTKRKAGQPFRADQTDCHLYGVISDEVWGFANVHKHDQSLHAGYERRPRHTHVCPVLYKDTHVLRVQFSAVYPSCEVSMQNEMFKDDLHGRLKLIT